MIPPQELAKNGIGDENLPPTGSVVRWYGNLNNPPKGWIAPVGQTLSKLDYPNLYKVLSESTVGITADFGTHFTIVNLNTGAFQWIMKV